jgi:hypothetical protein
MRFVAALFVALVACQSAHAQPSSQELITKFRKTIGADVNPGSIPYLIQYRGQRYLYSVRDERLLGESFDFDGKLYGYTDKHNKHRKEFEMKIGVVPFKIVEVIAGDKGWYQMNEGEAIAMSKAEVEGREGRELHVEVFLGRESFDPGHWQFTQPKGAKVRGQDAWMFEAKKTSLQNGLTLYFAKDSGLLLRLTTKTSDFAWLPGEKPKLESFTRDLYFSDWKKFTGRMLPGHLQAYHDGVLWQQMEPVSVTLPPTIDDKMFTAPQAKN